MDERWWTRIDGAEPKGPFAAAAVRDSLKNGWLPASAEVSLDRVLWASAATCPELQHELLGKGRAATPSAAAVASGEPVASTARAPGRPGALGGVVGLSVLAGVFWLAVAFIQGLVVVGGGAINPTLMLQLALGNSLLGGAFVWIAWFVWRGSRRALNGVTLLHGLVLLMSAWEVFHAPSMGVFVLPLSGLALAFAYAARPHVPEPAATDPGLPPWVAFVGVVGVVLLFFVASAGLSP